MKTLTETTFNKHKGVVHKQAWKWCQGNGFDVEEMISEGYLLMCLCYSNWDKARSTFSTWLTVNLNFKFQDMVYGYRKKYRLNTDILGAVGKPLQRSLDTQLDRKKDWLSEIEDTSYNHYEHLMDNIPGDCKRLVRIVVSQQITNTNSLMLYLRSKGWKWKTIRTRVKKVKTYYKENRI
jgi:hypothetical protein